MSLSSVVQWWLGVVMMAIMNADDCRVLRHNFTAKLTKPHQPNDNKRNFCWIPMCPTHFIPHHNTSLRLFYEAYGRVHCLLSELGIQVPRVSCKTRSLFLCFFFYSPTLSSDTQLEERQKFFGDKLTLSLACRWQLSPTDWYGQVDRPTLGAAMPHVSTPPLSEERPRRLRRARWTKRTALLQRLSMNDLFCWISVLIPRSATAPVSWAAEWYS